MIGKKDDIIDWSAFDEAPAPRTKAPGAPLFRVLAAVLFVVAIGGTILGGMGVNEAFRLLGADDGTSMIVSPEVQAQFFKSFATLGLSLATLVPACFALSAAAQRKAFLSHLLIVVCGLVLSGMTFVVGIAIEGEGGGTIDPLWAVFTVLAIAYLVIAAMVSWNSRTSESSHAAKKEELWDEKDIWKNENDSSR